MDTLKNPIGQCRQDLKVFSGLSGGKLSWWQKKAPKMGANEGMVVF